MTITHESCVIMQKKCKKNIKAAQNPYDTLMAYGHVLFTTLKCKLI